MPATPDRTTRNVLAALYATLLLLCVIVLVALYHGQRQAQRHAMLERLGAVTSSLATQLNPAHLDQILAKYDGRGMVFKNTQDAWYYVQHDLLRRTAHNAGLAHAPSVLYYDSLKKELQVVITGDATPRFRHPFEGDMQAVMEAYSTGMRRSDATGATAMDVLRHPDGRVAGVVWAHTPVQVVDGKAQGALLRNLSLALLLFLTAGVVLFSSVGRWLRRAEVDHRKLLRRHSDITDSIAYAAKIQRALVPSRSDYDALFEGSFIIDRPKDLVSGDFHWVHRIDDHTSIVAAADCTGHGLPGAMMAAIGCSLLNEVVGHHPDKDPAEMLSLLNTRLVTTLHQQGVKRGAGDGMDIALCRIDRQQHEILFAGAMRPLYWLHRGQVTVINGDRRPVGGSQLELDRRFTCHRLGYAPGDRIYLFSDGYVDQFGGPERKRFMSARLHGLLQDHHHLPLNAQAEVLERAFLDWKGAEDQVDDVCLLGLAV